MAPNKDRVYIALYVRGGALEMPGREDTYVTIIGLPYIVSLGYFSRTEPRGRWASRHAISRQREGNSKRNAVVFFDEQDIPLAPTGMLLVRIMIGKVEDKTRLVHVLRNTPIRQGQPGWNCVIWVQEVLEGLKAEEKAMGRSVLEWESVRDETIKYCQRKKDQHRFDGQGSYHSSKAPTYDLTEGKETIV